MATLHIEHPISDLNVWLGAFARFEDARKKAGVRVQHVRQPVDDDKYIHVALDFDSVEEAEAFKTFLETKVWGLCGRVASARRHAEGAGPHRGCHSLIALLKQERSCPPTSSGYQVSLTARDRLGASAG